MLNKAMLIGRLGKDPELKAIPDGTPLARFSLVTQRSWRDEVGQKHTETEWHNVVAWGKLAEIVGQYMKKGLLVYVEGRLQTHSWKEGDVKHYRTEVVAEQAWLLEWSKDTDEQFSMPTEELPV